VTPVADALAAFRAEKALRERGFGAVAVWTDEAVVRAGAGWWHVVGPTSPLRPDPLPPPQAPWWRRAWRGGKWRRR
jgi:hypothetical protein